MKKTIKGMDNFKQQRLPSWQPIFTASTAYPYFLLIGIAFLPIGILLLLASNGVQEIILDYTDNCNMTASIQVDGRQYTTCKDYLEGVAMENRTDKCTCTVDFEIATALKSQVYLYYGLTNFHQNHRRYVKSRDDKQLLGKEITGSSALDADCNPYKNENESFYAPCGLIANSIFNDKVELFHRKTNDTTETVNLNDTNIAWNTDKNGKFHNPKSWENAIHPPNWNKHVKDLSADENNNGYKNEDLMVWMRTAAFPTFRKLFRIVDMTVDSGKGMPAGRYSFDIEYNYLVSNFQGTKQLILSTTSIMGGKNSFLGIAYIVIGSIILTIGVFFVLIHANKKK